MIDLFRTGLTVGTVVGATTVLGPWCSLLARKDERAPDPTIRFWARSILASAAVQVQVHGLDNLPARHAVLVCNHQSYFDVLSILAKIPRHIRFVAKKELYKIPIFGPSMRRLGNVSVDRTGSEQDRQALKEAVEAVRERMDLLFFPEGTRSSGGLREFKKGAAVLAIEAQVPMVPLGIAGTEKILPKGARTLRSHSRVSLRVGPAIPTLGLTWDDRESLTKKARAAVETLVTEANADLGGGASDGENTKPNH